MTDIDPRIQERRIEIIRAKGKKRLRILLMLVLLILISLAAVLISKSSLLDVNEVVVIGVDSELEELIVAVANIPESKPLLRLILELSQRGLKKYQLLKVQKLVDRSGVK